MEQAKLKPAGDAKVRDPATKQHLAPEGEDKPLTNYWLRRIASKEVERVNEAAKPAAPAPVKATPKTGE